MSEARTIRPDATPQVGVGIVGYGYWGPKLFRNFTTASTTAPVAICEADAARREYAQRTTAGVPVVADLDALLALPQVEAVAIATPVATHHPLAMRALAAGKHVFVEKPLTRTAEEACAVIRAARERDRVLMVDHTFLYAPAVRKLKEIVDSGQIGDLLYYDSTRINLGLFQPDVDVIWDLAPHDFSILDYIVARRPERVAAVGSSHSGSERSDVAYVSLDFGGNLIGHLHLNWLAPLKIRQVLVGGSKRMVVYNDVLPDEKLRVYDRGIEVQQRARATLTLDDREGRYQTMISYRTGDVHVPWLDRTEALFSECEVFGDAVLHGTPFDNDGLAGLRVVLMLEAASRSLAGQGRFEDVRWEIADSLADR